jgi:putative membrane protein
VIVRDKPTAWELFFVLRGSVVPQIYPQIAAVAGLSLIVMALQRSALIHIATITPLALSVIGAALAIFAAFRNAAAYDRWWEARKLLGLLVIDTRALARQSRSYIAVVPGDETPRRIALRCIAFFYVVRDYLRGQPISEDTAGHLLPEEHAALTMSRNPPNLLLEFFSADIAAVLAAGRLSPQMAQTLEDRVQSLSAAFASAERTKVTPMPFVYTLLVHRTAYLFCFLLPFGLADSSGYWTPWLAAIVSYTFFGLDAIGDELSSPFANSANTMPLDAMARVVEINILESLGEKDLPEPLKPKNFVLT